MGRREERAGGNKDGHYPSLLYQPFSSLQPSPLLWCKVGQKGDNGRQRLLEFPLLAWSHVPVWRGGWPSTRREGAGLPGLTLVPGGGDVATQDNFVNVLQLVDDFSAVHLLWEDVKSCKFIYIYR